MQELNYKAEGQTGIEAPFMQRKPLTDGGLKSRRLV